MATPSSKKKARRAASLVDDLASASVQLERDQQILLGNQKALEARFEQKINDILGALEEMNFRITFMLMRSTFVIKQQGSILSMTPPKTTTMSGWELLHLERENIQREMAAMLEKEAEAHDDGEGTPQSAAGEGSAPGDTPSGDPPAAGDAHPDAPLPAGPHRIGLAPAAGDADETRH